MRRPLRYSPTARRGFTLVELLVSVALCIMIMAILATAFSIALDTLSLLKSIATLTKEQQAANTIMTRDFEAQHLEGPAGETVRVSDSFVATQAWSGNELKGFFRVRQGSAVRQNTSSSPPVGYPPFVPNGPELRGPDYPYLLEGLDSDGTPSFRATDHSVHFTVKLSGKTPQDAFLSPVPNSAGAANGGLNASGGVPAYPSLVDQNASNGLYVSKWAEIAYFLVPTLQTTVSEPATGLPNTALPGLNLFTLYRRQKLLSSEQYTLATPAIPAGAYTPVYMTALQNQNHELAISLSPTNTIIVNTPVSINTIVPVNTLPNRMPLSPVSAGSGVGSDILLTNVVSMQIRLIVDPVPTLFASDATNPAQVGPWVYDTTNPAGVAKPRPRGIQIKLRIYDPKNRQTRQMNLTFAL